MFLIAEQKYIFFLEKTNVMFRNMSLYKCHINKDNDYGRFID